MTDRLVDKTRRSLKLAPSSPESTGRLHFSFFFFRRVSRRRLFKIPDLAALMAATRSLQWEILTWTVALLRYYIEIYMEEKARFTLADEKKKKDDEGSEGGKKKLVQTEKTFPVGRGGKKKSCRATSIKAGPADANTSCPTTFCTLLYFLFNFSFQCYTIKSFCK